MNSQKHKEELSETTTTTLNNIDTLPLFPNNKLNLYSKYLLSKLSWHLTIADIPGNWVKEMLVYLYHKKLRSWLDISINGTLDTVQLPKSKLGLNIIRHFNKVCTMPSNNSLKTFGIKKQRHRIHLRIYEVWFKHKYDNCKSCKDIWH